MTPLFEQVTIPSGHSWGLLWRELEAIPFIWHYHPQFELTLTVNARGQRYIGDHLGDFEPGDLVLVGPNLPHTWSAHERIDNAQPMLAVVVWFSPEWITQLAAAFPELHSLRHLAMRAGPAFFARDQRPLRHTAIATASLAGTAAATTVARCAADAGRGWQSASAGLDGANDGQGRRPATTHGESAGPYACAFS